MTLYFKQIRKAMKKPIFPSKVKISIQRYPTVEEYLFVAVRDLDVTDEHVESIYQVCNEENINKWLFRANEYTKEKAKGFLIWGKGGWSKGTHFVFLILTPQANEVVGAIDIKNTDLEAAEVGYWMSSKHRGLATNSLNLLKYIAKQAGYKKLFAQTKEGNDESVNVLKRCGFIENSDYNRDSSCSNAFVFELTP
jgi:RimJ/RimL family protein N-acetyltransferase